MSAFDHVAWDQLRTDLELSPLSTHAREVIARVLAGKPASVNAIVDDWRDIRGGRGPGFEDRSQEAAVSELERHGLIFSGGPSGFLREIVTRGLLDELLGEIA